MTYDELPMGTIIFVDGQEVDFVRDIDFYEGWVESFKGMDNNDEPIFEIIKGRTITFQLPES